MDYSPWGCKTVGNDLVTKQQNFKVTHFSNAVKFYKIKKESKKQEKIAYGITVTTTPPHCFQYMGPVL